MAAIKLKQQKVTTPNTAAARHLWIKDKIIDAKQRQKPIDMHAEIGDFRLFKNATVRIKCPGNIVFGSIGR